MRIATKIAVLAGAVALAGAAVHGQPARAEDENAALPLKEFMGHVVQRNAMQLWAWTTFISDEKGERYAKPSTDEEWEDAESDALALVELGERMKIPERQLDGSWDSYVNSLQAAARGSARASEAKDFEGMIKAANEVNDRCVACHMHYVPDLERPPSQQSQEATQ